MSRAITPQTRSRMLLIGTVVLLATGCGTSTNIRNVGTNPDAGLDVDGGLDAGPGLDGGGGTSLGTDAGVDGGSRGGTDAGPDAGVDGGSTDGGTCSPGSGCPNGNEPICNPSTLQCVQCLSNSDCTSLRTPFCDNNVCVQCVTNGDCDRPPWATPICVNHVCAQCLSNNDCNGLVCCSGDCVDTKTYSNDCGSCGNVCPSGMTCQSGACQ